MAKNAFFRTSNKRLERELTELDADLISDSESGGSDVVDQDQDELGRSRLSLFKLADSLMQAAKAYGDASPSGRHPLIVMRLSRLTGEGNERIARIIEELRLKGVVVRLGVPSDSALQPPPPPLPLIPTTRVNLDLSLLIAFISDITHAPLPVNEEEVETRFRRPSRQRRRLEGDPDDGSEERGEPPAESNGVNEHSRALTEQLGKERKRGIVEEVLSTILPSSSRTKIEVEFWTTEEARDRCLDIAHKIGGEREKRRAKHMFDSDDPRLFFEESRHDADDMPGLPVRIIDGATPVPNEEEVPTFFSQLARTTCSLLDQLPPAKLEEESPNPKSTPGASSSARPKYTAHTLRSMYEGARRGWTTLSSNRASVKGVLREMAAQNVATGTAIEQGRWRRAALWVVEPRSLAEDYAAHSNGI
jgi:hypothetical protein